MSLLNRIANKSRIGRGRAKQKIGRVTGNRRLQAEGLADRVGGSVRQLGEDVKGELKGAGRSIERTLGR